MVKKGPGPRSSALRSWGAVGCAGLEIPRRKQNAGGILAAYSLGDPLHVLSGSSECGWV